MKKNTAFILASLVTLLISWAENKHIFNVVIVDGNVSISQSEQTRPLILNDRIFENDSINLDSGAYVVLIHKTGNTLELKKKGMYQVNQLSIKVNSLNEDYGENYTNFLFKGEEAQSRNYTVAGVNRPSDKIKFLIPNKTPVLYDETFRISWAGNLPKNTTYRVEIQDFMGKKLLIKNIQDTSITLNLSTLKKVETYNVIVKAKGHDAEVLLKNYKQDSSLENDLKLLAKNYDENKALDCVIISRYFEHHNLFLHAQYYLEKAVDLSPNEESFRNHYQNFLANHGLQE